MILINNINNKLQYKLLSTLWKTNSIIIKIYIGLIK